MFKLYKLIKQNQKLADKRNPIYYANKFSKILIYFMVAYWAALLLLLGVALTPMLSEIVPNMEPYHIFNQGWVYLLAVDFLVRFLGQPATSQEIKPYLLLPIPKNRLIATFLLQSGLGVGNLFWFFAIVPFAFLSIIRFYGFGGMALYLIGCWLLFVMNNYWYKLCKMLLGERTRWLLLPLLVYGAIGVLEFVPDGLMVSRFTMNLGEGFILGNPLNFLAVIIAILLLFTINVLLQKKLIYEEIAKVNKATVIKRANNYTFLEKYGEIGEYLKLEIKLISRNKTAKNQFRMGFIIMMAFSMLSAFTDAYDGTYMKSFICIYNFAILGIMTLGQVLSFEGNYLDGLMSRKESIYSILRAKYYTSLIILLIPFCFLLFPVFKEKMTLLMVVSQLFFTAGCIFAMLMHTAIFNKHTIPLNSNVMRSNKSGNMVQGLITAGAFMIPLLLLNISFAIVGETATYIIFLVIGAAFVATHKWWIKSIYHRFMQRRYTNMEGFRSTR